MHAQRHEQDTSKASDEQPGSRATAPFAMRHAALHALLHRCRHMATASARQLLDTVLPPRCLLCHAPVQQAHQLCGACWRDLPLITGATCPASGLPLIGDAAAVRAYTSLPALLERVPWRALHAACFHDGAARALVHRLKFHDDHAAARLMAQLMWQRLRKAMAHDDPLPADTVLLPVPLHRRRLWHRRFNQSALLARHLARLGGWQMLPDALLRLRPTPPQTGLSGRQRRRNLRHAFHLQQHHARMLHRRPVLLIDDVFTTGATARACAAALRKAGAGPLRVVVFALASERRALHI